MRYVQTHSKSGPCQYGNRGFAEQHPLMRYVQTYRHDEYSKNGPVMFLFFIASNCIPNKKITKSLCTSIHKLQNLSGNFDILTLTVCDIDKYLTCDGYWCLENRLKMALKCCQVAVSRKVYIGGEDRSSETRTWFSLFSQSLFVSYQVRREGFDHT